MLNVTEDILWTVLNKKYFKNHVAEAGAAPKSERLKPKNVVLLLQLLLQLCHTDKMFYRYFSTYIGVCVNFLCVSIPVLYISEPFSKLPKIRLTHYPPPNFRSSIFSKLYTRIQIGNLRGLSSPEFSIWTPDSLQLQKTPRTFCTRGHKRQDHHFDTNSFIWYISPYITVYIQ